MTARGRIAAEVEMASGSLTAGPLAYVFAARGGFTATAGDRTLHAEAGELIECREEREIGLTMDDAAIVLLVRLRGADGGLPA